MHQRVKHQKFVFFQRFGYVQIWDHRSCLLVGVGRWFWAYDMPGFRASRERPPCSSRSVCRGGQSFAFDMSFSLPMFFFFVKVILFKIWFASIFCWRELLEARLLCACRNSAVTSECRARERLWKRSWRRSEMPARPWLEHPFRQEIFAKVSRNRSICTKTYWVSMILLKFSSEFLSRNLLWITGWSLAAQGPLFDARRMMFRLKVPGLRVGKGETGLIA